MEGKSLCFFFECWRYLYAHNERATDACLVQVQLLGAIVITRICLQRSVLSLCAFLHFGSTCSFLFWASIVDISRE